MKGLLRYLSPFAPDQSGAVAVLYDMGGITVVCDAGGCTGNICGFDEPRWTGKPGRVFSAGLRDMDAILGRDDKLIAKLADVASKSDAAFAAIVGTPVPAVIGTDFRALGRMAEKKCGLPAVTVECTGTRLCDRGASDAYLALFKKFTEKPERAAKRPENEKTAGILGMTPLDISLTDGMSFLRKHGIYREYSALCPYGMGAGIDAVKNAGNVTENIVVSPSGLKAAEYLKEKFGVPYRLDYPFIGEGLRKELEGLAGRRTLVIHQQIAADRARSIIENAGGTDVTCATWFEQVPELTREGDRKLETEEQYIDLCENGRFDAIAADPEFLRAARMSGFTGTCVEFPHFAVSGVLADEESEEK